MRKPTLLQYTRYVADVFCLFNNEEEAENFFVFLNRQHPSIMFTMGKEIIGKLPFLDVLLDTSGHSINTSVFRKKTYTRLLTNYFSFTPFRYKIGLIKTLFDRAFKIKNSWLAFIKTLNIFRISRYLEQNVRSLGGCSSNNPCSSKKKTKPNPGAVTRRNFRRPQPQPTRSATLKSEVLFIGL